MNLRIYVIIWSFLTAVIGHEYWALSEQSHLSLRFSFLSALRKSWPSLEGMNLSTEAGRPFSYFLGWLGFGFIVLTNLYILRKNWRPLSRLGSLPGWLDFHIFCGLFGPSCIIFHSDFKVRGLVAISFWSMIVVLFSGLVGHYIYSEVVKKTALAEKDAARWTESLESFRIMLGYWHSFHMPFAFFMYLAAVIHIAVALLFRT